MTLKWVRKEDKIQKIKEEWGWNWFCIDDSTIMPSITTILQTLHFLWNYLNSLFLELWFPTMSNCKFRFLQLCRQIWSHVLQKKKNISIKLMWHSHFRHLQCTHEKKHIFQVFKPAESHIDCWKGWFQTKSCLCLENKYEICYFMRIYIHLLKVSYCFFRLKNWPNPANTLLCIKHHEKRSSWSLWWKSWLFSG